MASNSLTDEELKLQRSRGEHYKRLLHEAMGDLLDGVDRDRVGLMLSGGIDSTTTLWTLLNHGVRPYVYTFQCPTSSTLSTDAKKAQRLAEYYKLPIRIVQMPREPDDVAAMVKGIHDQFPHYVSSRADFEVLPFLKQMMEEARDKDGVRDMFSGIADAAIHLTNRKLDIRARNGRLRLNEANARRIFHLEFEQNNAIVELATSIGVRICLPLLMVALLQPYHDVPWHVMNTPRRKAITIDRWKDEEEESGVKAISQPLQTGDSGAREYYDTKLAQSPMAERIAGKRVTTGVVFYNALKKTSRGEPDGGGPRNDLSIDLWDFMAYVRDGQPLPAGFSAPELNLETGRATISSGSGDDILGLSDPPEYTLDASGEPDTRVDCEGRVFAEEAQGVPVHSSCPRAQAGLCGTYSPGHPFRIEDCPEWDEWNNANISHLAELGDATSGSARAAYKKWSERGRRVLEGIRQGTYSFH